MLIYWNKISCQAWGTRAARPIRRDARGIEKDRHLLRSKAISRTRTQGSQSIQRGNSCLWIFSLSSLRFFAANLKRLQNGIGGES